MFPSRKISLQNRRLHEKARHQMLGLKLGSDMESAAVVPGAQILHSASRFSNERQTIWHPGDKAVFGTPPCEKKSINLGSVRIQGQSQWTCDDEYAVILADDGICYVMLHDEQITDYVNGQTQKSEGLGRHIFPLTSIHTEARRGGLMYVFPHLYYHLNQILHGEMQRIDEQKHGSDGEAQAYATYCELSTQGWQLDYVEPPYSYPAILHDLRYVPGQGLLADIIFQNRTLGKVQFSNKDDLAKYGVYLRAKDDDISMVRNTPMHSWRIGHGTVNHVTSRQTSAR